MMDIDCRHISPNFDQRRPPGGVDTLVLHYTGMRGGKASALRRLCSRESRVSCHYLISRSGKIHALVEERHRAWHAGEAIWNGVRDINSRSIGIELVHPGHDYQDHSPFPEAQMESLIALAEDILSRHPVAARNVVGHSDIAPGRKKDPGEWFDWPRLAAHRIGLWEDVRAGEEALDSVAQGLRRIGYGERDRQDSDHWNQCLEAFQRRFLPERLGRGPDRPTRARVAQIARLFTDRPP